MAPVGTGGGGLGQPAGSVPAAGGGAVHPGVGVQPAVGSRLEAGGAAMAAHGVRAGGGRGRDHAPPAAAGDGCLAGRPSEAGTAIGGGLITAVFRCLGFAVLRPDHGADGGGRYRGRRSAAVRPLQGRARSRPAGGGGGGANRHGPATDS